MASKAAKIGLMGFAQGFLADILEGFKTERARKAKQLEMAELRAMQQEDRAIDRQWRTEDRKADTDAAIANREDTQAFNAEQRKLEAADRAGNITREGAMRLQALREEGGLRASIADKDRAANIEMTKMRTNDPPAVWEMPDGTIGEGPASAKPPDAILRQLNGKNMYPPKTAVTPARPGLMSAPATPGYRPVTADQYWNKDFGK